ncbi:oligosaccharide flippase family protein [Spiribacter aquaticus]|uniref:Oligosaccharide flippase family protein n=2 Tax=Ectothiorhodospiraceae TaxID=72276 RepID=A0A557RNF0_9GAMM|nr:hypothetical protein BA897_03305 [Spiribacter roseus]TVO66707.1 oligosaccharide flippase family protein [Spiribacter aquaticus]
MNRLGNAARRLLPKNRFIRSVSILAGGTAAGQIIVVAASPVLTRLYSPEDFGLLAVFASLLGILGVVASLRFELAIPLPESDDEAASLTVLSLLVVVGMALLATAIVIPWRAPIAAAVNAPLLEDYIWLLPLGLFLMGVYQVFNYWAIRTKSYPAIARTKLTQAVSMIAVQIGGYALGPVSLLLGRAFGQAAGTSTLGSLAFVSRREAFRKVTLSGVYKAAARYCNFPLYSSWAGLLNAGGSQIPPILFSAFYSAGAAGLYILAHRVIAMPMTLVGSAIADVFMPNAIDAVREARLRDSVASLQRQLAWIALPPAALLFVAAPEAFRVAFGADWEQAGYMIRWLTPMLVLQFVVSPLSRIFVVLQRQRLSLLLQANLFLLRLGCFVLIWFFSPDLLDAVIWFGLVSSLGYFAYFSAIASLTQNTLSLFLKNWAQCLPWIVVVVSPLLIVSYSGGSGAIWEKAVALIVSASGIAIFYDRTLIRRNRE